ncbi:hypothetical protein GCM10027416_16750 [Okibacterium endophyticum]
MSTPPSLSPERRAEMREWVMRHVERRKRRRRRVAMAGVGVVGVAALVTAAWVVIAPQLVQERWAFCYEEPSLDASHSEGVRSESDDLGDPVAHALDMCATLWATGIIGQPSTGEPPTGEKIYPVPELTLCVRTDQSLAVFPTGEPGSSATDANDFCSSLGLRAP